MLRLVAQVYFLLILLGALPFMAWAFSRSPLLGGLALATVGPQWLAVVVIGLMRWINPPTTAFMWRVGRELRQAGLTARVEQTWAGLAALSPELQLAAIAGEDIYFALHTGFDWESLRAAYAANQASGRPRRGGSTITQQLAKNLFLWEGRNYVRKGLEAYFTLLIEAAWPKWRILEVYLNLVQFGQFTFGAEAAARRFFNKPARDLTQAEAALLVAVLSSPNKQRVDQPERHTRYRQLLVIGSMRKLRPDYLARLGGPNA